MSNEYITTGDLIHAKFSYDSFQNSAGTEQCKTSKWKADTTYGVCGIVAPMYVEDNPKKEKLYEGGAPQFNTPGSILHFIKVGVIREKYEKS